MYKLLLCWRYLRTRYIALASIISVMLGVATMIVVNAVMEGFTHEMQDRIHGILSDLVFESHRSMAFPTPTGAWQEIRKVAGEYIAGMSPTVHVPAMLGYSVGNQYVTKQITLIGVDEETYAHGQRLRPVPCSIPTNRKQLDFNLKDGGYDTIDHQAADPAKALPRSDMAGRRLGVSPAQGAVHAAIRRTEGSLDGNPFVNIKNRLTAADGASRCSARRPSRRHRFRSRQGAAHRLRARHRPVRVSHAATAPTASWRCPATTSRSATRRPPSRPRCSSAKFTVVDFYESKMSEYDSSFVFVPIRKLQELRGMIDPDDRHRQLQRDPDSAQSRASI